MTIWEEEHCRLRGNTVQISTVDSGLEFFKDWWKWKKREKERERERRKKGGSKGGRERQGKKKWKKNVSGTEENNKGLYGGQWGEETI